MVFLYYFIYLFIYLIFAEDVQSTKSLMGNKVGFTSPPLNLFTQCQADFFPPEKHKYLQMLTTH